MNREQAAALVDQVAAAFPNTRVGGETAQLYASVLEAVSFQIGGRALARWIFTEGKWPTLADLRGALTREAYGAPPDGDHAWLEVMRAVQAYGYTREPAFSHPAIADTVRALSWSSICNCQVDEQGILRAHFTKFYAMATKRLGSVELDAMCDHLLARAGVAVKALETKTAKQITKGNG